MKLRIACLVAGACVTAQASADSFFIANVINAGAEARTSQIISELIKTAVADSGAHRVTENAAKSDFTLQAKIIQLGNAFIISLDKRKAGEIVFSSQLKAENLDEIDVVLGRLVRAVILEKRVKENAEVGEATSLEEKNQLRSREVQGRWYLAFGPSGGAGTGNKNMFGNVSMGRFWDIDDFSIITQFSFTGSLKNENATMTELGLGTQYFFSRSHFSPFLGSDLNWAWTHVTLREVAGQKSQN